MGLSDVEANIPENKLAPPDPRSSIGVVGNVPHQGPNALFKFPSYDLAIIEFDDLGCCHDRNQIRSLADRLIEFDEKDAIIVVFVHGWKHDARSDDDNLKNFLAVLEVAVKREAEVAGGQRASRPVLGVFIGWRGMSLYDRFHVLEQLTFWDRQEAGRRVSTGSIREVLGRLRRYRNKRGKNGGAPLLVIVGHSFGGMIVYSAVAQSLIEAAATPRGEMVPSFADLVLLVNPAVEAARYLPIQELVEERRRKTPQGVEDKQPPVFVCVTASNDWATSLAFPFGNAFSLLTEKYKDRRERQALLNAIGHISWMKTHDLSATRKDQTAEPVLIPLTDGVVQNPFWVVQATPDVINGHNEIFKPVFLEFVAELLGLHVKQTALRATRTE
jgi:hypothetical protein